MLRRSGPQRAGNAKQNNYNVSTININRTCVIGSTGGKYKGEKSRDFRIQFESSWRLHELTVGAVTIEVVGQLKYLTTRIENDHFLQNFKK